MSAVRAVLVVAWLVLAGIPMLWWLASRRRVDVWSALPVPAALLGPDGRVLARTGPHHDLAFAFTAALPANGHVVRTRGLDGTELAVGGVRGGAIAVALPAEAVTARRDRILADLGSRLAHDINTPLGALHGHLDLIAHEPISPAARESVRTCQRELLRLQTTASDLLAFTRLRAGGGRRDRHLAGALAEEAAAALIDTADGHGAQLVVVVPNDPVAVEVAEADLVRVLRNLIANALTHGLGEARNVTVEVLAEEDAVTFAVADSGPGMTQVELDEMSQPMVRGASLSASSAASAEPAGSGLGLAIAAEVLAAHGSRLVSSRGEDGRARVGFTLGRVR